MGGAVPTKHTAGGSTPDRLRTYRDKRDFSVTAEPSGEAPSAAPGNRFVVQRHRATRLHYDLRLEAAGVLLSWAVPKGPTLDPDVRRMAVHVEDHPLDAVAAGDLHFDLRGEKLGGRFALVRRGPAGDREQWLLIHKHDDDSVVGWDPEAHPRSVKTGRTNDEVRDAPAATWSSTVVWGGPNDDELAALDALGTSGQWQLGEHRLRLTNLDKALFPAHRRRPALTKRDLIRHYATVAPAMLPYLHDRPVNLHRYPDGIDAKGFWHKARPDHAPDFVDSWRNEEADPGETEVYAVLRNPAALAWAANFGAVEIHPWTSTTDQPNRPTWALIDLDPGESTTFDDLLTLAELHRTALDHLGVEARPKVTGKRGIQIWIPVQQRYTFDETRAWVERLSRLIGRTVPELVSWEWETAKRGGLARLDYTQNAINKTLVAPFSVRAAAGAPVSVPITWEELADPALRPDRWTIVDIAQRLRAAGDPLAP